MCVGRVHLSHILLILVAFTRACGGIGTQKIKSPALDFSKHNIVQLIAHHGRTKREILSTRHASGGHHSEVQVTVPIHDEQWILDLRLNEDLVVAGHTLQYQEEGKTVQHKPKKEELDLCHYSGSVRGKPQSWVAVSTCHGVRGVIFDGQRMRYIEPAQGPEIQSLHYLYDHNDFITEQFQKSSSQHAGQPGMVHSIGEGANNTSNDFKLPSRHRGPREFKENRASRSKRQSDNTRVREPFNANKSSRYVELLLVADYDEFQKKGHRDVRALQSRLIEVTNIINSIYVPLNIYIALVGVVVWNERDQIRITENGQETLNNFLKYRKNKLVKDILHDNAFLINPEKFDGTTVGMAQPLSMCKLSSSGGIAVDHSDVIGLVAATIAHEIGHNFGMHHDEGCQTFECPDKQCIMTSTLTGVMPVHWSSCSIKSLQDAFEKGQDYCLHNKPDRLIGSPTCGNGFIEPGEECDCGTAAGGGTNPCHACCRPDTCMLRANATCGAGACCDLTTCQPKPAGTECRSADRECDLAEHCSGHSEYCPADVYKMDSTPCGVGEDQAYCVQGQCRSHSAQCRLLWGGAPAARSHAECYSRNTAGTETGNCGRDSTGQYKPCAPDDAVCGLLQCHTENNWIAHAMGYGYDSGTDVAVTSYVRNRERFDCYTARFNLGTNNVDLGLVPDGAKCGDERMCLRQRCVSVAAARAQLSAREPSACRSGCSGHGVCNSEGHCHCDAGFAPPLCDAYGSGGSIDSGPINIKSNGRSVDYKPNTNPNGNSVNSRPYNIPTSAVDYRPNTKVNDGLVNSRPYNKPTGGSVDYRPNTNPSGGSVDYRPNPSPSGGSVNPRPYNNPSGGSVDYRPNTKSNDGSVNSRPYNKSSGGSVDYRPNTNSNGGLVNSRPNNKPSGGFVDYRPNTNPSAGSVNPRPYNKPSDRPVDYRPNTNDGSVNPRPYDKPSGGSVDYRPNTKPNDGSVNSRPYNKPSGGSVDYRPNTNDGSVNSRPYDKPSGGSVGYRPNTKPNDGSVNSKPYNKPSGGSVDYRPNTNNGSVNSRPYDKPSGGSTDYRPNTKPNGGSVDTSPNIESRTDWNDSRPTTKPRVQRMYMIVMYVIFLGIVPFMFLLFLIYFYTRHNMLWQQPKKLYTHYIASCTKTNAKSDTMQSKKSNLDIIYKETDINPTGNPISALESELVKPVKKITKDDIYIIPSDDKLNTGQPVSNIINKDNIQIAIKDIKLKHVKPVLKTIADNSGATDEIKSLALNAMKTSENSIPIPTNGVKLKPVNAMTTIENYIPVLTNGVKLKPATPVSKPGENNIPIPTNGVKLKPLTLMSKTGENNIPIPTNGVKLKPVKPMAKADEEDLPKSIYNVKLKPVKPISKTGADDTQMLTDVKLKPVKPFLLTNKPKSLITAKPEWLNDKPIEIVKPGNKLAITKEMLSKGRLTNVGEGNVKK